MKISIITPTMNSERFLKQTITSVLSQNYKNLEYIIKDGGSTDLTLDIIKSYHGIKLLEGADNGMYSAINTALRTATGDVVAYLNSDDLYQPGVLSYVSDFFEKNKNVDVLYGGLNFINENSDFLYKRNFPNVGSRLMYSRFSLIGQPSSFWRKSVLNKVGYFNENFQLISDFDFFIRCTLNPTVKMMSINKVLAAFRIHHQSLTSTQKVKNQSELTHMRMHYGINDTSLVFKMLSSYLYMKYLMLNSKNIINI